VLACCRYSVACAAASIVLRPRLCSSLDEVVLKRPLCVCVCGCSPNRCRYPLWLGLRRLQQQVLIVRVPCILGRPPTPPG
jgi:hypothetical protein